MQAIDLPDRGGIDEDYPDLDGLGIRGRNTGRQQQRYGGDGHASDGQSDFDRKCVLCTSDYVCTSREQL